MKPKNKMLYQMLATSRSLKYKEQEALDLLNDYFKQVKKPYIAFSGGKDSTVLMHLVSRINKNVDVFTMNDDMDFPDKNSLCEKIVDECGMKNFYVGEIKRTDITLGCGWFVVVKQFIKEGGYDGCLMGLRAEESKARRFTIAKKGLIYDYKKGSYAKNLGVENVKTCLPVGKWKGKEVFAYIFKHKLSYHKIYDCDDFNLPHDNRFSWIYDDNDLIFNDDKNILTYKLHFPEVYAKLENIFGNKIRRRL